MHSKGGAGQWHGPQFATMCQNKMGGWYLIFARCGCVHSVVMSSITASESLPAPTIAAQPVAISADGSALLAHTVENVDEVRRIDRTTASATFQPRSHENAREAFRSFFDIEQTARFIVEQKCSRIGLQFPDELLPHSTNVVRELREEVLRIEGNSAKAAPAAPNAIAATQSAASHTQSSHPLLLYILADTSYGSCCVDEVAAQHANCDLIVHFGFSCLSRSAPHSIVEPSRDAVLDVHVFQSCSIDLRRTRRMPARYVFGRKPLDVDAMLKKITGWWNAIILRMPFVSDSNADSKICPLV